MAIRCSDTLTMPAGERRADALIGPIPGPGLAGDLCRGGVHGPREFDWARVPVRPGWKRGREYWLLARRSISDPDEIAYYACYGPRRSSTADLAWIAGSRWHIEECFQHAQYYVVHARPGLAGRQPGPRRKRGSAPANPA